jgi:hypothetical protein
MLRIKSISSKVSNRAIAKILSCSHQSVNRIINKAKELNLDHSLAESPADSVLYKCFIPKLKPFKEEEINALLRMKIQSKSLKKSMGSLNLFSS